MGRRAVVMEAAEAARRYGLRNREGWAVAPRDGEGLSQPGAKHLLVSRFRSR